MAYGYTPANALAADKAVTAVGVRRMTNGDIFVEALGEQRVGLTRTLTRKYIDASTDNTAFKRTWETIWELMNGGMAFQEVDWDNYAGLLGIGSPSTDTVPP